jgi:AraC-like DNA-binding protein
MTGSPNDFAKSPFPGGLSAGDALSNVLRSLRLKGGLFLDAQLTAPWSVNSQVVTDVCKPVLHNPSQMIGFHLVTKGRMLISVAGGPMQEVNEGEVIIIPRNDVHELASQKGLVPVSGMSIVQFNANGGLGWARYGGGGDETRIICGFFGTDGGYHPLLAALPPSLKISLATAASRGLIETSIEYAAFQSAEGVETDSSVIVRLSELLFTEAVRIHAAAHLEEVSGWLKIFNDPQIGRTLTAVHDNLARSWTVEELASMAAMSRSAFMDRFAEVCGMPPIRYLTHWRLRSAKSLLVETGRSIATIAAAVGYESEAAFSKAFKREFGMPPSTVRS